MRRFTIGALLGALAAFFLDPRSGRRRRVTTRDGIAATARHAERLWRRVDAQACALSHRVQHLRETPKDYDDATLTDKVESELFRFPDIPKGHINVNVEHGVVVLRGQVETREKIEEIVRRTRVIHGVEGVESLLHTPGTEAPMHH